MHPIERFEIALVENPHPLSTYDSLVEHNIGLRIPFVSFVDVKDEESCPATTPDVMQIPCQVRFGEFIFGAFLQLA